MRVKCPKCGYEWETKSKLKMVTCPSCSVKSQKENIELKGGQDENKEKNK